MCQESISPHIKLFFLFLDSITSNKLIHIKKIYISEGGWPSLRHCSKLQISLIPYFHTRSEIIPIFAFLGFNHVPRKHPTTIKLCFWFIASTTSTKLIHNFLKFMGVVDHPYAIPQNCKYFWYHIFMFVRKLCLYLHFRSMHGFQPYAMMTPHPIKNYFFVSR